MGGDEEWLSWLRKHHLTSKGVWLVFRKVDSGGRSISYDEAINNALAFGWIDSVVRKIDDEKYARKFTPRRSGSVWSKLNIERVERLRHEGKMTRWGLEAFAKRTGEVSFLEKFNAGAIPIPDHLEVALRLNRNAWAKFQRMPPSQRKRYMMWVAEAKKKETRERRVAEAVRLIEKNVKNLLK